MLKVTTPIPVAVFACNRLRYLDITLKSLSDSLPPGTPVTVYHDGNPNPAMLRYLLTDKEVEVQDEPFPNDNKDWLKFAGNLPNPDRVQGVKNKVSVVIRKERCGTRHMGLSMLDMFQRHPATHVIRLEDDVLLKPGWYRRFTQLLRHLTPHGIGLLSGFRHFYGKQVKIVPWNHADLLARGFFGGVLVGMPRSLLRRAPAIFKSQNTSVQHNDDFWINSCRDNLLPVCASPVSVCQHVGILSEAWKGDPNKAFFSPDGHVNPRRIDPEIVPPYCLAPHVATFRPQPPRFL